MKWMQSGDLAYLTAPGVGVPHAFTTRKGGVSRGYLTSLNLGCNRGDAPENVKKNYEILGEALGFDPEKLVLTRQIHSDIVRVVGASDCLGFDHGIYPACDGLVTNTPGVTLAVFTADCTPVLLYDPETGAVGAVHAGWRGTAADIAGGAVRAMQREFGCCPGRIRAAIGPNIGPCCFETDGDVPRAMVQTYGAEAEKWIRPQENKFYVNLKEMNALSLRRAGVELVDMDDRCTACCPELFWSHRRHGAQRGAQGALICCKGVGA